MMLARTEVHHLGGRLSDLVAYPQGDESTTREAHTNSLEVLYTSIEQQTYFIIWLVVVVTSDYFSMQFPFPPPKCCDHIMCTKDWYPVCAGDTVSPPRTFLNMCELDRYNCYSGNSKSPFLQNLCELLTCLLQVRERYFLWLL
uniref:Kazal-like domain-containing protein n=1 Tax=Timema shepardi TaxID=629360 RepID=A0A7R9BA49_TIMSH|nr:unnamed protein product [Timema shepardi]